MFSIFNRHAQAGFSDAHSAVNASAPQSAPAKTSQQSDASNDERPATYEELMPYLVLAMACAV